MKIVFLALILASAPAALAVDYEKCEAIQKAFDRVSAPGGSKKRATAVRIKHQTEFCGGPQTGDWWKCDDGRSVPEDYPRFLREWNELESANSVRLEKIKADYNLHGCY